MSQILLTKNGELLKFLEEWCQFQYISSSEHDFHTVDSIDLMKHFSERFVITCTKPFIILFMKK